MPDCCLPLLPLRNSVRGRIVLIDSIAYAGAGCIQARFASVFSGLVVVFNDYLLKLVCAICIGVFRLLHSVYIKSDLILIISK